MSLNRSLLPLIRHELSFASDCHWNGFRGIDHADLSWANLVLLPRWLLLCLLPQCLSRLEVARLLLIYHAHRLEDNLLPWLALQLVVDGQLSCYVWLGYLKVDLVRSKCKPSFTILVVLFLKNWVLPADSIKCLWCLLLLWRVFDLPVWLQYFQLGQFVFKHLWKPCLLPVCIFSDFESTIACRWIRVPHLVLCFLICCFFLSCINVSLLGFFGICEYRWV